MKRTIRISFPDLLTNRLVLRKLEPADASAIFALRSHPQVNKFVIRPPLTGVEDGMRFIHRINSSISDGDCLFWAVVPKQSDELVGTICLWNWNNTYHQAEIGFELLPSWQGKGLMHEAMGKVLPFAFEELKFAKVEAWVHSANQPAIQLVVKNGFQPAPAKASTIPDAAIVIYCRSNL